MRLEQLVPQAKKGHIEVVRALLEADADVNKTCEHGRTSLHVAALYGRVEVVSALIGSSAVVDLADSDGRTRLDVVGATSRQACDSSHYDAVKP